MYFICSFSYSIRIIQGVSLQGHWVWTAKLSTIMKLLKTPRVGGGGGGCVHMLPVSSRCQSDRCEVMINTTASQNYNCQSPYLPPPQFMTDFCKLVSLFWILYVKLQ